MSCCDRIADSSGPLGLYVHVPFCLRKCHYCDFYSVEAESDRVRSYLCALATEVRTRAAESALSGQRFDTLYVGGGTPTCLSPSQIGGLLSLCLQSFAFQPDPEVTVEANPETIDREKLRALLRGGANRLSIGVQSLDDRELLALGRAHTAARATAAYEASREAGFKNVCLDLMFGLPDQSLSSWQKTLRRAVELGPEHVSTYALTLEPGTPLPGLIASGELRLPDSDTQADLYELAIDLLAASGYEHYEISNFALPRFRSRHNLKYWHHLPYLGIGAAAHSFTGSVRRANVADVEEYVRRVGEDGIPSSATEVLSLHQLTGEAMMLGLRMADGISLGELWRTYGLNVGELYRQEIEGLLEAGLLVGERGTLRLTRRGLMMGDTVFAAFVEPAWQCNRSQSVARKAASSRSHQDTKAQRTHKRQEY